MKNRTRAFTLIELLVVIAILAVLAALAFPAVGGAVSSSQRASALNSIKQISTLAVTYAADHNGMLPEEGGLVTGKDVQRRPPSVGEADAQVRHPVPRASTVREADLERPGHVDGNVGAKVENGHGVGLPGAHELDRADLRAGMPAVHGLSDARAHAAPQVIGHRIGAGSRGGGVEVGSDVGKVAHGDIRSDLGSRPEGTATGSVSPSRAPAAP